MVMLAASTQQTVSDCSHKEPSHENALATGGVYIYMRCPFSPAGEDRSSFCLGSSYVEGRSGHGHAH